jgi:hypothetical protein
MAGQTSMSVGYVLASLSAQTTRVAFEVQFNQMQNTVIRRLNDEIEKANAILPSEERRIEGLEKEKAKLAEALPVLQQYRDGVHNSQALLSRLRAQIAELIEALGPDDQVEPGEVELYLEKKQEVKTLFDRIFAFAHEDVSDGEVVRRVKAEGRKLLDEKEPVVGTKEDNQELLDSLSTLAEHLDVAADVNYNNLVLANQLEQDTMAELAGIDADVTEVNVTQQAVKLKKVEELKARYAAFLQAISASFEVNQGIASSLTEAMAPSTAKGTIVDLFS